MLQKITPENSTVLGYHDCEDEWPGLLFDHAKPMQKTLMMVAIAGKSAPEDLHLSVPYQHPSDPIDKPENLPVFPVRPKSLLVTGIEKINGSWHWLSETPQTI